MKITFWDEIQFDRSAVVGIMKMVKEIVIIIQQLQRTIHEF